LNKYKHIFFDLDNTLWDFEANSKETLSELFDKYLQEKVKPSFEMFFKEYVKVNAKYWERYRHGKVKKEDLRVNRFHDTFLLFGLNDKVLAEKFATEYLEICPYKKQVMPGCFEVLDYLKEKGYPMVIITNGFDEVQHIKMENCGLSTYFQGVVTSEKLNCKKPYPDIFHHAFSLVNAKAESSLMIGDNHDSDIVGAANLGMDSVYLKLNGLPENFKGRYIIDNLLELKEIV